MGEEHNFGCVLLVVLLFYGFVMVMLIFGGSAHNGKRQERIEYHQEKIEHHQAELDRLRSEGVECE